LVTGRSNRWHRSFSAQISFSDFGFSIRVLRRGKKAFQGARLSAVAIGKRLFVCAPAFVHAGLSKGYDAPRTDELNIGLIGLFGLIAEQAGFRQAHVCIGMERRNLYSGWTWAIKAQLSSIGMLEANVKSPGLAGVAGYVRRKRQKA
jgi:hypothetical protein